MMSNKVESWGLERFEKNAKVGVRGFETILKRISVDMAKWREGLQGVAEGSITEVQHIIVPTSIPSLPPPLPTSPPMDAIVESAKPRRTWISLVYPARTKPLPSSDDQVPVAKASPSYFRAPKMPTLNFSWSYLDPLKLIPTRSRSKSASLMDELVEEFEHQVEGVAREVAAV
jgi:hypothetical protein